MTNHDVKLKKLSDGTYLAVRQRRVYRFLLNDGRTIDVHTDRDDSHVHMAVLAASGLGKDGRVAGVAELPDDAMDDDATAD